MSGLAQDLRALRGRRLLAVVAPLAIALFGVAVALPRPVPAGEVCSMLERVALNTTDSWDSAGGSNPGGGPQAVDLLTAVALRVDYHLLAGAVPERLASAVEVGRTYAAKARAAADAERSFPQPTAEVGTALQAVLDWYQETCW